MGNMFHHESSKTGTSSQETAREQAEARGETGAPPQMIETGIKVVDLLAPLWRGGAIGVFDGTGVGTFVLVSEVIYTIVVRYGGDVVIIGESADETGDLMQSPLHKLWQAGHIHLLPELHTVDQQQARQIAQIGLASALQARERGREVLLIFDINITVPADLLHWLEFHHTLQNSAITALLLVRADSYEQEREQGTLDMLGGYLAFDAALASQRLYPTLHRCRSGSRLLADNLVHAEHARIAQQVRALFQPGMRHLSEEQMHMMTRLQLFFSQPLFIAEPIVGIPGKYVPLSQTLSGCKQLLSGCHASVPAQAFAYAGSIEEVLAKGDSQ